MKVDLECDCGVMKIHYEDNFKGYIYTCAGCGKVHRGGFWLGIWLFSRLPIWFLVWRGRRRMHRFLKKAVKIALVGSR